MTDEVPSLNPSIQRQETSHWSRGEGPFCADDDVTNRHLRVAAALVRGHVAVWLQLSRDVERCCGTFGVASYQRELNGGPFAGKTAGWLLESTETALRLWPGHPLVGCLGADGAILARLVSPIRGEVFALCVLLPQGGASETERQGIDELAQLLAREVVLWGPQASWVEEREQTSSAGTSILDACGGLPWLYRQIVRQLSERLMFVFDRELRLRLIDGTIAFPAGTTDNVNLVGASIEVLDCGTNGTRLVDACNRALLGEQVTSVFGCGGRHYDLTTVPLRDRSGSVVLGLGLVHDNTEDSARDAVERLLSARLRTLVDSLDSGILVEDENQVIQHCNQHFCTLMQIADRPQDLIGKPSPELIERISPAFFIPEALSERIDELKAAAQVAKDELVYLADMRILERSYSPLELDGKAVGHLWAYRDVTDRERNKDLLQRQADQLRALSLVDELTGLYNRRGFLTLATQQLKLCDRSMRSALLVFVDLDGMKRINDDLGHEYGDQALVETASVLRQCFRYSDVVARLGGDEFVVLAVEADPPSAELVTERLYEKLAEMNDRPERRFELKFSVGIAPYDPSKLEMVEEVLARADGLMYEQKRLRKSARKD